MSTPNRLIHEKSPYLLQHAHNPVDWYPWGEEALARAVQEQKPIFLSIGYSTCHWCHVMERESFESPEIAELLNRWFVCIKVDREEHPDLDQVYMTAVTAMTGQGGWPLTVVLTPERKPFFGGTYFPPERRWNRPGMKELLPAIAEAWQQRRDELLSSAERLTASLSEALAATPTSGAIAPALLDAAFHQAADAFDASSGGFGEAPKFPRSHELSFLLRYWRRTGTAQALEMVTATLDHLARGGIRDHLGGGFHRYSTDAQWLVPHFEKMHYDQALLATTYLEAYRITRRDEYAAVAREIFEYVLRDLTDSRGGFYSAEDADSEGEEGKCYVWTLEEILPVLGPEDGERFTRFYGVAAGGHFEHGASILHIEQPLDAFAKLEGLEAAPLAQRLAEGRAMLLAVRNRRVRPHRDDKILTSWNGLMIAALAYGAATLEEPHYLQAAGRAAEFILEALQRDGRLLRRFRDGEARFAGTLEDYAFFSHGLLELYEAGGDARWLAEAKRLAMQMVEQFRDEQDGGFFLRGRDEVRLILQAKEVYDGATPAGGSVAACVLLRLGRLTADAAMEGRARQALERAAGHLAQAPFGSPVMLGAADFALGPTQEIVIAGDPQSADTAALLRQVHGRFLPRAVLAVHPPGPAGASIEALAPYVKAQGMLRGQATAYVCEQFICKLPTSDPDRLAQLLQEP
ncbi:MAG: thioredoxin domain-containing protein [Candidatus Omnitrophica bacterium]|nr:thioredoxin domain-containing protein [Candidatus Omnitrophota bacterium]